MKAPWWAVASVLAAAVAVGVAAGILVYPRFFATDEPKKQPEEQTEHVKLSAQARANLGLSVAEVAVRGALRFCAAGNVGPLAAFLGRTFCCFPFATEDRVAIVVRFCARRRFS